MALTVPSAMLGTGDWATNDASPDVAGIDPTAGGLLIYMAHIGGGIAVTSVTDDIGDTGGTAWTERVNALDSGVSRMVIYSRAVGNGPSEGTITLNLDANSPRGAHGCYEYLGQHATTPTSDTDSKTEEDSEGVIGLDGITLDAGNSIACCAGSRGTDTIAAGANTTIIDQADSGVSDGRSIAFSTATGDPNWTNLLGSVQFAAAVEIVPAAEAPSGRIMGALAGAGGLAGSGGLAGAGGGIAG